MEGGLGEKMKKVVRLGVWAIKKYNTGKDGYNTETRECLYCGTIVTNQSGGIIHECMTGTFREAFVNLELARKELANSIIKSLQQLRGKKKK